MQYSNINKDSKHWLMGITLIYYFSLVTNLILNGFPDHNYNPYFLFMRIDRDISVKE